MTGKIIASELDKKHWAQIYTAFQVRHLIEHRKGRADKKFIDEAHAKGFWGDSSWNDVDFQASGEIGKNNPLKKHLSAQEIQRGAKIGVRGKDFDATFGAMCETAPEIINLTKNSWKNQQVTENVSQ